MPKKYYSPYVERSFTMGKSRNRKYIWLGSTVLFSIVGVFFLAQGFGWFFLGIASCTALAFFNDAWKVKQQTANQLSPNKTSKISQQERETSRRKRS